MLHQEQQDRYPLKLRFFNNIDRFRCLRFPLKPFLAAHDAISITDVAPKKPVATVGCYGIPKPTLYNPHKY